MTPEDRTPAARLPLLAVDLETTGLYAGEGRILAIGWVPVDCGRVDLARARRRIIRDDDPGEAVTIHRLTHDELSTGVPLRDALGELRRELVGRALLAHHAPFDVRFLTAGYRSLGEGMPSVPVVDTLRLQRRVLTGGRDVELPRGALRLWQARRHFGLPTVPAHDALGDALACAELYLAQVAELDAGHPLTLRDLRVRRSPVQWVRGRLRRWRHRRRRRGRAARRS